MFASKLKQIVLDSLRRWFEACRNIKHFVEVAEMEFVANRLSSLEIEVQALRAQVLALSNSRDQMGLDEARPAVPS